MKDEKIETLLRQTPVGAEPQPGCPDEIRLAAYFEGGLNESQHRELCEHFADCDYCLDRLGVLGRCNESDSVEPVSELLTARARQLVPVRAAVPRPSRRVTPWAAAAMLALALGFVFNLRGPGQTQGLDPTLSVPDGPAVPMRETRFNEPLSSGPNLVWPRDGENVRSAVPEFSWTAVPGAVYYDLRIVSDLGDLVWEERVADSRWQPSTPLPLRAGSEYFVRIDARVSDAGTLSSDFVPFRYRAGD